MGLKDIWDFMTTQPTQETVAIAQLLRETDLDTLAEAIALAGEDVAAKLIKALALAELRGGEK